MNIFDASEWDYKIPYLAGDVVYVTTERGDLYYMAMKANKGYFPEAGTTWMLIWSPKWDIV